MQGFSPEKKILQKQWVKKIIMRAENSLPTPHPHPFTFLMVRPLDQTNCIFMTAKVEAFKFPHIKEIYFTNQNHCSFLTEAS